MKEMDQCINILKVVDVYCNRNKLLLDKVYLKLLLLENV